MNHKQLLKGLLTLAILICTQVNAWALNHTQPLVQEDVVLQWNRELMETVLTPRGIYFTFDNVAGQSVGRNVANYIFSNVMRPRQSVR